ncbi:lipoate--protein ligase family protein [Bacillaceae bacterium S4-13-56]
MNDNQPIRLIDQSDLGPGFSAIDSFAIDDALCLSVGDNLSPFTARLWVHHNTVVLGIPDTRIPYLNEGIQKLKEYGYQAIVRNSGGLAVVLDEGILNLSFIYPNSKTLSIHDGYEHMVSFIRQLYNQKIDAYTIEQSYCPGDYDLSINGQKFAGISQRRVKNGVAVQIYLCVEGSGSQRAQMIQTFYEKGIQGETTRFSYPHIDPSSMASLSELLGQSVTVGETRRLIMQKLMENSSEFITGSLTPFETEHFLSRREKMVERNERAWGRLHRNLDMTGF